MNRKVSVERLYTRGNYQNVKFVDEITDIPEHIALNKDAMNLLHYAQLLEVERANQLDIKLKLEILPKGKLEDVINETLEVINEEQSQTWEQLLEIIQPKEETKIATKITTDVQTYSDNPNEDEGDK